MFGSYSCLFDPYFFENDTRVGPDLDALSALGDAWWYCIGFILWAMDLKLPTMVTTTPAVLRTSAAVLRNSAGVITSCSASLDIAGYVRGADQDTRFFNKQAKLMKSQKDDVMKTDTGVLGDLADTLEGNSTALIQQSLVCRDFLSECLVSYDHMVKESAKRAKLTILMNLFWRMKFDHGLICHEY